MHEKWFWEHVLESTFNAWRKTVGYYSGIWFTRKYFMFHLLQVPRIPWFEKMCHQKNITWKKQNENWLLKGKVFIAYLIPNTFARKFCSLKAKFIVVWILRDNTIIIHYNLINLTYVMKNTFQAPFWKKNKKTINKTFGSRNGLKLRPP